MADSRSMVACRRAPGVMEFSAGCDPPPRANRRNRSGATVYRWCLHLAPVVWRLSRDDHVMHMALAQAGIGDPNELTILLHVLDGAVAGVAHGRLEATDELMDHRAGRPFVGHAALHTFGHQLQLVRHLLLEVAVGRAARHGAERS